MIGARRPPRRESAAPARGRCGAPAQRRGRARPWRGDRIAAGRQARHGGGDGRRIARRHRQAAAGVGDRVVAGRNGTDHRPAGHHVVHQLVRADAESEQRLALQAEVEQVHRGEQSRDRCLGHRLQHYHVGKSFAGNALLQRGLFRPAADEQPRQRRPARKCRGIEHRVERIGQPVRAGIGHQQMASCARRVNRRGMRCGQRRRGGFLPLGRVDAVRHMDEFLGGHAVLAQVLGGAWAAWKPQGRRRGRQRSRPAASRRRTDASAACRQVRSVTAAKGRAPPRPARHRIDVPTVAPRRYRPGRSMRRSPRRAGQQAIAAIARSGAGRPGY